VELAVIFLRSQLPFSPPACTEIAEILVMSHVNIRRAFQLAVTHALGAGIVD
jgi:hypothetical protein